MSPVKFPIYCGILLCASFSFHELQVVNYTLLLLYYLLTLSTSALHWRLVNIANAFLSNTALHGALHQPYFCLRPFSNYNYYFSHLTIC
jgi:hypothetical protein